MFARARASLGVSLLLCAAGCAHAKSAPVVHPPPAPPAPIAPSAPIELHVVTDATTNRNGPFFLVLCSTDDAGFLSDDYDKVAAGLFGENRDPKVLKAVSVVPGETRTLRVDWIQDRVKALGVYFLFTSPGRSWRFVVKDHEVKRLEVALGENEIRSISEERR